MIKVNGVEIDPTIFPDGTSQVWKVDPSVISYVESCLDSKNSIDVYWDFDDEAEIFHLCQLADLLLAISSKIEPAPTLNGGLSLICAYLPYARQDKEISNETTFALSTFNDILSRFYDTLIAFDVHNANHESFNLWNSFSNINPFPEMEFAIENSQADLLCFPDSGAKNRYVDMFEMDCCVLKKVRNQLTGEIVGLDFESGAELVNDKNVLILDDLCDGGRTFVECANLMRYDSKSISLYVSHGLFTKGKQPLYDSGISKIYDKNGLVKQTGSLVKG